MTVLWTHLARAGRSKRTKSREGDDDFLHEWEKRRGNAPGETRSAARRPVYYPDQA